MLAPLPDKVSKVMNKIDKMVLSKPKVALEGPLSRGMGIGERLNENSESSKGQSNGGKAANREFHFRKLGNAQYTKPPEQPPAFIRENPGPDKIKPSPRIKKKSDVSVLTTGGVSADLKPVSD